MATICVIVPVFKVEKYINRCVDSILSQTYSDFELILVDDGSPDRCGQICDSYAKKDERIQVIHQENGGLSAARNAGLEYLFSKDDCEWVTFIDSDDWIHPRYLEALQNAVQETGLAICGYERTHGETPRVDINHLAPLRWNAEEFFCTNNINATIACGKLFRKSCFTSLRFPVGKIHEDEFTTYQILFSYNEIAVIHEPLYFYYENPNSIMNAVWNSRRLQEFEALKEQKRFFKKHGYVKAEKFVARHKAVSLSVNLKLMKESKSSAVQYMFLKSKLQWSLLFRCSDITFTSKNYWIYETAFPLGMRFLWIIQSLRHKLRKKEK